MEVKLHAVLTYAQDEIEWPASRSVRFIPAEIVTRTQGGLQSRYGHSSEEKNPPPPLSLP
jgi:hypothetical protein